MAPQKVNHTKFRGSPMLSSIRGYTAYGALMGAVWWLIRDVIVMPHGYDTYDRHLLSYGLMGGALLSTIYHPANFIYGFAAGVFFGSLMNNMRSTTLPRGMEWKIKAVDEEKRRRLLREDEEYELSSRNLVRKHNPYPL